MISAGSYWPASMGVGHTRHRQGGVGFAAAVAGERHPHQAGVLLVLQIAPEDAVLDQDVVAARRPLVIDGDGAASTRQGAVVDYGAVSGGDLLADAAGEGGGALAVEVPSRPWPTASCSSTPGQLAPSTTGMVPAGASMASRFTRAWRTASRT